MLFSLYNPNTFYSTSDASFIHYDDRNQKTMRPYAVFACPANPAAQEKQYGGHRHYVMNSYLGEYNADWEKNRGATTKRSKVQNPASRMVMVDADRGETASWQGLAIHMRKYITPGDQDYPEGYGYVYMENTCYDPGNASMGVTYTILSDGDRRYVYGIQCGDMLVYADCTYVLGKALYADISACTDITLDSNLYAFSSLRSYMYYAVGGKVYRVDLSESPAVSELQFELPGETITCLKFNLYQNSSNSLKRYDLVVGSETSAGEGTLRIYEGYYSEGNFSGAVPSETYTGFATITDATYKERIY